MVTTATATPANVNLEESPLNLKLAGTAEAQKALEQVLAKKMEDPAIAKIADQFVNDLLSMEEHQDEGRKELAESLDALGIETQKRAGNSEMLRQPIRNLEASKEGAHVSDCLINLKTEITKINPNKFTFSRGWLVEMFGWIPGVGTTIEKYLSKFLSSQEIIEAIRTSLVEGRQQLQRNNEILQDDMVSMRAITIDMQKYIRLGQALMERLYTQRDKLPEGHWKRQLIEEELIFKLQQRVEDLQESVVVNQQGVITFDLLIKNNSELIRGITRTETNTLAALNIAVAAATALADQERNMQAINSTKKITEDLIMGNAQTLKTKGVAIHKMASGTNLDVEKLGKAFELTLQAMDDVATFRKEAIEVQRAQISKYHLQIEKGEAAIQKLERGKLARAKLSIDNTAETLHL